KGRPLQNMIQIEKDEKVKAVINVNDINNPDYVCNHYLIMCTEQGIIKKTTLEAYSRPRANGINAININDGDHLLDVKLTNGSNEVVIATRSGRAIRFNEAKVRPMGRTATGVKSVTLEDKDDYVVGMATIDDPTTQTLLVVSEKGYGKRTDIEDYRITNRGGKGVRTLNITEKTGLLVSILRVIDGDDLMIINKSGIIIRTPVDELRVMGRATQGVRLIKLSETDKISSIARIEKMAGEDEVKIDDPLDTDPLEPSGTPELGTEETENEQQ
ncbi:MAG TPA: DNA gyrase C-terminal beta-propeller domain-containing protein, partial [Cytophagales bacterium]|nr:DNA gyrase C-terminal beta-propeller domain-containing protein [Cytophagales bacterium]